jgi:hypothetical protein
MRTRFVSPFSTYEGAESEIAASGCFRFVFRTIVNFSMISLKKQRRDVLTLAGTQVASNDGFVDHALQQGERSCSRSNLLLVIF